MFSTSNYRKAKQPGLQSCAGADGTLKNGGWPIALGGLLGAQSWITAERAKGGAPIVVIPGNNQVANFTFLREQVLVPNANYRSPEQPGIPADTREGQAQRQILRFWYEMGALKADAIGLSAEDFVRSLRDPREERGAGERDRCLLYTSPSPRDS